MRRRLAAVLLVALLGGCGVPVDDSPRPLLPPRGSFPSPADTATADPDGRVDETLCFVRNDRLEALTRWVDGIPDVDTQLQHLLAGPDDAERDAGMATALPGTITVAGATATGTVAMVDVREAGDETGRSDEVLAFGQIVCTLTHRSDVDSVAFRRDGQPLAVPRADGSLSALPLTAADYRPLLIR
ncbi:GerMN domain-containing protein [Micromonospora yasonensis]|uniref:GerMN domain-containing protein n=1 Tax=Micromonospora yasonensis TaxID=1128667 RepID=UPI00222EA2A7|nr:GerMN domain-containing protein [Micromonospora yasonensis]MCW3845013.1 GerMN domain-containing protein [Micromonospora yasonensis]